MHYGHWSDYLEQAEKGTLTGNCIPVSAPQPSTCFTHALLHRGELYALVRAIQAFNGALYIETALFAPIYLLGFFAEDKSFERIQFCYDSIQWALPYCPG